MSSIYDFGGPDRLQALATEWAEAVHRNVAGRALAPGSAAYLDAANDEIWDRLKDLRIDAPFAAALVMSMMRKALASRGGAQ